MSDVHLRALVLACTAKPTPEESRTHRLAQRVLAQLEDLGASGEVARVADYDDASWRLLRARLAVSDILVVATPTVGGQPSPVCLSTLERLGSGTGLGADGKVAMVAVPDDAGEDADSHHVVAEVLQALNDAGFTAPATAATLEAAARNAVHLAYLLHDAPYPVSA